VNQTFEAHVNTGLAGRGSARDGGWAAAQIYARTWPYGAVRWAAPQPVEPCADPGVSAAIAGAVVRIHRRVVGRGPTKARAFIRDDVAVVILRDALTTAERTLATSGREDVAAALRAELLATMRGELAAAVEDVTGRGVVAVMSDSAIPADVSALVFLLDRPATERPGLPGIRWTIPLPLDW
jgi:uncharacterized protein YbcI